MTGGEGDPLSAEMGKILAENVNILRAKINELISGYSGLAFVDEKPSALPPFNWDSSVIHVTLASSVQHLQLSGTLTGTTWSGTLAVAPSDTSTHGLPFVGDVSATILGSNKAISYNESTGAITIENVTASVEITALATELHGVDSSNNPVRWRMGQYFSHNSSIGKVLLNNNANGAFSEYIPVNIAEGDTLEFDMGTIFFTNNDATTIPYIEFYDSNKGYLGHIGQRIATGNNNRPRTWTATSNAPDWKFIRMSAYVPNIRSCYFKVNSTYIIKGDNIL